MSPHEILKQLRNSWITMALAALITILAAVGYALLQTPLYQSSTRLFFSTNSATSAGSASDLYQSSRYSQDRVLSYVELVKGETIALGLGHESSNSRIESYRKVET